MTPSPDRTEAMITASDLLSHFWSRPIASEVISWKDTAEIDLEALMQLTSRTTSGRVFIPGDVSQLLELLDEHERLFVGPGQVPCPPYESFWRENVPVDLRRSLMGPCTADLRTLYRELGLSVSGAGELPDHVAVEFEALAYALSSGETADIARRLFTEHLGHWLPRFCRAVAHDSGHDFYRDLAALTIDFVAATKSYFVATDTG